MGSTTLRAASAFILVAYSNMVQAGLIGVSWGLQEPASVYSIDSETGVGSLVNTSGFPFLNSAAVDPFGRIIVDSGINLISVDPLSGQTQHIVELANRPTNFRGIRGLAFSPSGELFAAINTSPAGTLRTTGLFTVDLTTGALAKIGSPSPRGIQGLAFSIDGSLFGWDVRAGLLSIDTTNGNVVQIGRNPGLSVQALEFGPDGTLYGGRDELYEIDVLTGEGELIGSGGYEDLRGLAYVQVPEGSALMGLLLGLGLLMIGRRRSGSVARWA